MTAGERRLRVVRPTLLTWVAAIGTLIVLAASIAFMLYAYPSLPDLLPVRFSARRRPIGWQYKTYARVLMPAFVQAALVATLGSVGVLILSRSHTSGETRQPDVVAASTTAEAIALVSFVWVMVQAGAAAALADMWQGGRVGLGDSYAWLVGAGALLTVAIGVRAHRRLGRPAPRDYVAEHWRFGQLYKNPADPALFVPSRDGSRWTLNFGRPVAAALIGIALLVGVIAPTMILALSLR